MVSAVLFFILRSSSPKLSRGVSTGEGVGNVASTCAIVIWSIISSMSRSSLPRYFKAFVDSLGHPSETRVLVRQGVSSRGEI
jgi:hypothetical protein